MLRAAVLLTGLVPAIALGAEPLFGPVENRSHVEKVNANLWSYSLDVGGSVDMDNTLTREFGSIRIAFQNNESLTIANTGNATVVNPRLIANDERRWWSLESMLEEILAEAETDQDKAYLIYNHVRKNGLHDHFLYEGDELHDPVKLLNVFGGGYCDDLGFAACSLFYHAGLNATHGGEDSRMLALKGHLMCEAYVGGDFQFLDVDQQTFYLDLENEKPVSGDAVARDHYLAKRELAYGPGFGGWSIGEMAAALFGRDDGTMPGVVAGHRIGFALRPGERIEYRWDNVGKFPSDDSKTVRTRTYWGNSLWVFEPRLAEGRLKADAFDVSSDHVTFKMMVPYAICGGRIVADFAGGSPGDSLSLAISLDGTNWEEVWAWSGEGHRVCDVILDPFLKVKEAPAKYSYLIRVNADTISVRDLEIRTDLMVSPLSLPRLRTGRNELAYTDETPGPHEITITHQWRESAGARPPVPPSLPLYPTDGAIVRATTFPFRWPSVANAELYHLEVSRRPDMLFTYRPSFDVYVEGTEHHSPFAGLFNSGENFFWRVRARDRSGVWGVWSPVWSFFWDGPHVPVDLDYEVHDGKISVFWKPNPKGTRPVRFEVYGSDERGFTPSKSRYDVRGLGPQPANFLKSVTGHCFLAVEEGTDHPAMNRSYYRIVAVDEFGVASGPSELIELPHPFVYSHPVTEIGADQPYLYEIKTLASLGDLQQRYVEPGAAFWEREGYVFELVEGPAWLTLDGGSGVLSGQPSETDLGTFPVTVLVRRTYPFEQKPDGYRAKYFQKDDERFQAEFRQDFLLEVK